MVQHRHQTPPRNAANLGKFICLGNEVPGVFSMRADSFAAFPVLYHEHALFA